MEENEGINGLCGFEKKPRTAVFLVTGLSGSC